MPPMDGDFRVDLDGVLRQVATADVISIYFPLLGRSLLIDTRYDVENDPLVRVVSRAQGPEDRLRRLQRMRPQYPRPESLAIIPWARSASSLEHPGIMDLLRERLAECGRRRPLESLERCLRELASLERLELARAITGDEYHTLWPSNR